MARAPGALIAPVELSTGDLIQALDRDGFWYNAKVGRRGGGAAGRHSGGACLLRDELAFGVALAGAPLLDVLRSPRAVLLATLTRGVRFHPATLSDALVDHDADDVDRLLGIVKFNLLARMKRCCCTGNCLMSISLLKSTHSFARQTDW